MKAKRELMDLLSAGNKTAKIEANSSINSNDKQNTDLLG